MADTNLEGKVRKLAYEKWERAGRPPGDGQNFWVEAEQEVKGKSKVAAKATVPASKPANKNNNSNKKSK